MTDKRDWLDLLLQHAVPEAVAQRCVRDAANDAQLIAKIKALASPGEGVERLLQVLSFPCMRYKRLWFNALLCHGLPADVSKAFLLDFYGGLPELEQILRGDPRIPKALADPLIAKVRFSVVGFSPRVSGDGTSTSHPEP